MSGLWWDQGQVGSMSVMGERGRGDGGTLLSQLTDPP